MFHHWHWQQSCIRSGSFKMTLLLFYSMSFFLYFWLVVVVSQEKKKKRKKKLSKCLWCHHLSFFSCHLLFDSFIINLNTLCCTQTELLNVAQEEETKTNITSFIYYHRKPPETSSFNIKAGKAAGGSSLEFTLLTLFNITMTIWLVINKQIFRLLHINHTVPVSFWKRLNAL